MPPFPYLKNGIKFSTSLFWGGLWERETEKAMAPHSSTLAWKIPWMEEPGGLQSMGSLGVRHNWATSLSSIGEGNGNPLQYSYLENPRDRGAWWAAVYGVAQSRTRLKRLSSSSSSMRENGASQVVQWQRICLPMQEMRCDPWVGKILWSRKWLPTPVFLPGKFYGKGAWQVTVHGVSESDTIKQKLDEGEY